MKKSKNVEVSFAADGIIGKTRDFIVNKQALDRELWKDFVLQFKQKRDDKDLGWRGEYWGKVMRGAALLYEQTKNEELYSVLKETVEDLISTQDEEGRITTYGLNKEFRGWDMWVRKYVMLGLIAFLKICKGKELAKKIIGALVAHADAIIRKVGPRMQNKLPITETSEVWEGLNSSSVLEPFVLLYGLTGKTEYLGFSEYIIKEGGIKNGNIFRLAKEDILNPSEYPVVKAYEMMSCFEGLLKYAEVTDNKDFFDTVVKFSRRVAAYELTVIGNAGCEGELFDGAEMRQSLDYPDNHIMQETCVAVTWMKLCGKLLTATNDPVYADYIETSFFNAFLGSVNTLEMKSRGNTADSGVLLPFDSYSPLSSGMRGNMTGGYRDLSKGRYYGCCAAIGSFAVGNLPYQVSFVSGDDVYVNMYSDCDIAVKDNGKEYKLKIRGGYPYSGEVDIKVVTEKPVNLSLKLRIPSWSVNAVVRYGNVKEYAEGGKYKIITGVFSDGDNIRLSFDVSVKAEDVHGMTVLRAGPIVLARDARLEKDVTSPSGIVIEEGKITAQKRPDNVFEANVTYELDVFGGKKITAVDYASAGKTWDEKSKMAIKW